MIHVLDAGVNDEGSFEAVNEHTIDMRNADKSNDTCQSEYLDGMH